jgi:hypothetical protein
MKNVFFATLLLVFLFSCNSKKNNSQENSQSTTSVETDVNASLNGFYHLYSKTLDNTTLDLYPATSKISFEFRDGKFFYHDESEIHAHRNITITNSNGTDYVEFSDLFFDNGVVDNKNPLEKMEIEWNQGSVSRIFRKIANPNTGEYIGELILLKDTK